MVRVGQGPGARPASTPRRPRHLQGLSMMPLVKPGKERMSPSM